MMEYSDDTRPFQCIYDTLACMNPEALFLPEIHNNALCGIGKRSIISPWVAFYDSEIIIENLFKMFKQDGCSDDDAYTFAQDEFYVNTTGGWSGESTPLFTQNAGF